MNNKLVVAAFFLFVASRIPFINTQPVFFDSAGYTKALSFPNLFDAIIEVHFPLHDWYIILFWPFYHTAAFLNGDPLFMVILGQVLCGFVTLVMFYKLITFLADKQIALLATVIISLTPLFWISNVTILYEISYLALFFFSTFFLMQYIAKGRTYALHLSVLLLSFAIFTHMMLLAWVPLYLTIVFVHARKRCIRVGIFFVTYFLLLALMRVYVISTISDRDLSHTFDQLYFGNTNNAGVFSLDSKSILVSLRNFFIPLMRSFTSLVVILGLVSLILLWFRNKVYFVYGLLWVGPAFVALQFWEAQLPGRYGILAGFGVAFLVANLIRSHRIGTLLVFVYLLIVSIPALTLLRGDIPYLKLAEYTTTLPSNSLLIESHFSRPQVQDRFSGKLLGVNEPQSSIQVIENAVDEYLSQGKRVFVSSAALTDPYGLYTGPYMHTLSLSYAKPSELHALLQNYTLVKHKVINEDDGIVMYTIVSTEPHPYPEIKSLYNHYRRIDNTDPLWKLYQLL